MGFGDELMGSGMARGAAARGKRIAFGDGKRIIWAPPAHAIYQGNPNVAPPGSEGDRDLEWVEHYPRFRQYCRLGPGERRWTWLPGFRPIAGEIFLTSAERSFAKPHGTSFVAIEPCTKRTAINKQWPRNRYQAVADALHGAGLRVVQFIWQRDQGPPLHGIEAVETPSFRHACALMANAGLYVGAEGGLHHAAAAFEVPAVVLFGGFIHPRTTGYDEHDNFFTGVAPCGSLDPCEHCRQAMDRITIAEVVAACERVWEPAQ